MQRIKNLLKHPKTKPWIYALAAIVAVLAVTSLLTAFNETRDKQAQELAELQKELQLQQEMSAALEAIKQTPTDTDTPAAGLPKLTGLTVGGSGLQIKTQEVGNAVIVSSVVLEKPGFISVYGGAKGPETLIATSPFLVRGAYSTVSIAVPTSLKEKTNYYVTINFDANDNGVFENTYDTPVTDDSGAIKAAVFTAQKPK